MVVDKLLTMDEWKRSLRKIQHHGYNKWYLWKKNIWLKKLDNLAKDWNQFGYQLKGSLKKKRLIKKYLTMEGKLKACIKKWRDMRKMPGWTQTFDNMRTNWRDRGKYLRGREIIYG